MPARIFASSESWTRMPAATRAMESIVNPSPRMVNTSAPRSDTGSGSAAITVDRVPSKLVMIAPQYLFSSGYTPDNHVQFAYFDRLKTSHSPGVQLDADLVRRIGGAKRIEKVLPQDRVRFGSVFLNQALRR